MGNVSKLTCEIEILDTRKTVMAKMNKTKTNKQQANIKTKKTKKKNIKVTPILYNHNNHHINNSKKKKRRKYRL